MCISVCSKYTFLWNIFAKLLHSFYPFHSFFRFVSYVFFVTTVFLFHFPPLFVSMIGSSLCSFSLSILPTPEYLLYFPPIFFSVSFLAFLFFSNLFFIRFLSVPIFFLQKNSTFSVLAYCYLAWILLPTGLWCQMTRFILWTLCFRTGFLAE